MKHSFRSILSVAMLLLLAATTRSYAYDREEQVRMRHELRAGWGDQIFERQIWHNPLFVYQSNNLPASFRKTYHEDYHYSEHVFLQYMYNHNYWFSIGLMADGSGFWWNDVTRDGTGAEVDRNDGRNCYNLMLMPVARFTYFYHRHLNMYSSLGLGVDVNGGTEQNYKGKTVEVGLATDLRLLGLSVNFSHFFMAADLGATIALRNTDAVYLLGSKLVTVSIGARF